MNINRSKVLATIFSRSGNKTQNTNDPGRIETFTLVKTLQTALFDVKIRVQEKLLVAFFCQGNWYILFTKYLSVLPLYSVPS